MKKEQEMKACQKTDKQIRELDRDQGFRIYKVRPSNRRVLFEIALIIGGFVAFINIVKTIVSHVH